MNLLINLFYTSLVFGVMASFSQQWWSYMIIFFSIIALVTVNVIKAIIQLFLKEKFQSLLYFGVAGFFFSIFLLNGENEQFQIVGTSSFIILIAYYVIVYFNTKAKVVLVNILFLLMSGTLLFLYFNNVPISSFVMVSYSVLLFLFILSSSILKYFNIEYRIKDLHKVRFVGVNVIGVIVFTLILNTLEVLPSLSSSNANPTKKEFDEMSKKERTEIKEKMKTTFEIVNEIL